jgi:hypothetical protein
MRFAVPGRLLLALPVCAVLSAGALGAGAKVHVIPFGKWISARWLAATSGEADQAQTIKVRALILGGRIREYVFGTPHEVTERLFVVQRVFRLIDSLRDELAPRWQWQLGRLAADRSHEGPRSAINLPDYDVLDWAASWYRDYAADCGVSDDGKRKEDLCHRGAVEPAQAGDEKSAPERWTGRGHGARLGMPRTGRAAESGAGQLRAGRQRERNVCHSRACRRCGE